MTTAQEVEMKVSKLQKAISSRYSKLSEECPSAAIYLCDEMEKVLVSHGLLTRVDLREGELK